MQRAPIDLGGTQRREGLVGYKAWGCRGAISTTLAELPEVYHAGDGESI
jgi:hypothetical protein